jgi:hypothetical protein
VPAVAELAVAHLTEPIGHEMPGMHGVYGHASPAMRADLKAALQERWEDSTRERARLREWSAAPRSGLEPRTCKNPGGSRDSGSRDRTRTYNLPVNLPATFRDLIMGGRGLFGGSGRLGQ